MHRVLVLLITLVLSALSVAGCDPASDSSRPSPLLRLDLNRATVKELEALPAIGPDRARSIMASRNARGGKFERLEDLLTIDGIGEKTIDAIRPYVEVVPK